MIPGLSVIGARYIGVIARWGSSYRGYRSWGLVTSGLSFVGVRNTGVIGHRGSLHRGLSFVGVRYIGVFVTLGFVLLGYRS